MHDLSKLCKYRKSGRANRQHCGKCSGKAAESCKATVDKRCTLSYRELKSIVERQMKKAIIRGDLKIPIKDLYEAVAIQQKIKIRFGTDVDNE